MNTFKKNQNFNVTENSHSNKKVRDEIFKNNIFKNNHFQFNQKVTEVFEDTLFRSIPHYEEVIRMNLEILSKFILKIQKKNTLHSLPSLLQSGSTSKQKINKIPEKTRQHPITIYDLGCSTGYFLKKLSIHLLLSKSFSHIPFHFIGVDNSTSMIKKAKEKCNHFIKQKQISFIQTDLNELILPENESDGIILNYTLQFLKKTNKNDLLSKIYKSLSPGGILILSEKIKVKNSKLNQFFIDFYHQFKERNHYSQEEIERKQKALEPILFLQTYENLEKNLQKIGFTTEIVHKWYNFVTFLAIKPS